jgi:hypothetical protein
VAGSVGGAEKKGRRSSWRWRRGGGARAAAGEGGNEHQRQMTKVEEALS